MLFSHMIWPRFQSESWCFIFSYDYKFSFTYKFDSFSYEWMSTGPRFEKEAKGNSEIACQITKEWSMCWVQINPPSDE